jgi:periplasmic protein TonB
MDYKKSKKRIKSLMLVVGVLFTVACIWGVVELREMLASMDGAPKKVVQQQITLVTPPPPPEPQPEPPKPEVEEEKIPEESPPEPEPAPEESAAEPPPGQDLGLDSDGAAGADGFGLIGKKGGRDLLSSAGPGGSYTNEIKEKLNALLSEDEELRYQRYRARVDFWINNQGAVERYEVALLDGDQSVKKRVESTISSIRQLGAPPPEMKQPISWQITSSIN